MRALVPIDGSARDGKALAAAVRAADPSTTLMRLIHVRGWLPLPPPSKDDPGLIPADTELFSETPDQAVELVKEALRGLRARGVTADGIVVEAPQTMVGTAIVTAAEDWDAEVIVLCRRPGRSATLLSWGRVSEQVMREAPCPVLLVRAGP